MIPAIARLILNGRRKYKSQKEVVIENGSRIQNKVSEMQKGSCYAKAEERSRQKRNERR